MSAYVVLIRKSVKDPKGLETYAEIARTAPIEKLEIIAAKTNRLEILEGEPVDTVAMLRFPSYQDAKDWYFSDEYQEAVKHRLAAGDYHTFLIDGSD